MRDLTNKVAWITGAGTGIGAGTALAYARAGMRLVLSGRREAELAKVAAEVARLGGSARVAPLDVADKDAVLAVAASIQAQEGRCDVLVNSAGLNVRERNWKH
ncbi:MAG TPA: SDR family NAD(P)-dependent oxidoreductase, partial [Aquabacterium sp.]|nr:SDR family NAD(P)-dependent oxidoreductase [Aquabacterium sp.]